MLQKDKKEMIRRTYSYNGLIIKIRDVKHVEDDLYDLFTEDGKRLRLTTSEMKTELVPVTPMQERQTALAIAGHLKSDTNALLELEKIMMQTTRRIQKDAKYIPQGKQINDLSKSLISLGKHKLDVAKFMKELHGK